MAAIAAGDAGLAAGTYSADARLVAPSVEPIEGREAITAFWRAGIDAGIRDVERVPTHVDQRGSIAFEIGRYAIRLDPTDGSPLVDRGKYLLIHELQHDGSWKWIVEMFTPDGPPEAAAPLAGARASGEEVAND